MRSVRGKRKWLGPTVGGFVLAEVMVAVMLSSVLVLSLAASVLRAATTAVDYRASATKLESFGIGDDSAKAWEWGPRVKDALWKVGPELSVWVQVVSEGDLALGMWADGWYLGEVEVQDGVELCVPASTWMERSGQELVLRVRESGGPWGPPWRCLVPDGGVALVGDQAMMGSSTLEEQVERGEGRVVVHVSAYSNPELRASWSVPAVELSAVGLTHTLHECVEGWCELYSGGRLQSWRAREGRALDVYF